MCGWNKLKLSFKKKTQNKLSGKGAGWVEEGLRKKTEYNQNTVQNSQITNFKNGKNYVKILN